MTDAEKLKRAEALVAYWEKGEANRRMFTQAAATHLKQALGMVKL